MFNLFRENIKDTFNITEEAYLKLEALWQSTINKNLFVGRTPLLYTKEYFEHILSLYYIVEKRLKEVNGFGYSDPEAILLACLSFYLVEDTKLLSQSEKSIEGLEVFYQDLVKENIITASTQKQVLAFLLSFNQMGVLFDNVSFSDLYYLTDLIISTNPTVILGKACMFYYGSTDKVYFKYSKQDASLFTPEQFFDASFKNGQKIQDKFLRELYIANLHELMQVQADKHIFPF